MIGEIMLINFSDLPNNNRLYLDFINDFSRVKEYYKVSFRDEKSYEKVFENICSRENPNKSEIIKIINQAYDGYNISEKTKQNIELLNDDKTIAIFTGQQLGLLGGPLYTIYKIFTAVKLSEYLNTEFQNYNFVPVFWMAGDDHDFEEISSVNIITKENELKNIEYTDGQDKFFNRGSVGDLEFKDTILQFKESLQNEIRETEFTPGLIALLDNVLDENITIKDSFFRLIYQIFDDTGLIIFNPQAKEVKKLLIPIFKKELTNFKEHTKDLLLNSADLDDHYHAQVKIKPINLFLSDDSGRHLVEPIEDEYRLKGKRKRISQEEILQIADNEPERFSANVLLRPICEDYLFPTGFYIGGPGEISYYAQAIPLYKHYNLQHPIIYPRASATIIEGNIAKILIKYNLSSLDFFKGSSALKEEIVKSLSDYDLDSKFDSAGKTIDEVLTALTDFLTKIDGNLKNVSNNSKGKILHQLEILQNKSLKAQEQRFDASLRQITKAQNLIYPNDNLQEREFTIIDFINKYGFDFFDWVYNELEIKEFKHQILEI
jgi:bacillithiol biosynthesis cysteine-adding enzyme BshC